MFVLQIWRPPATLRSPAPEREPRAHLLAARPDLVADRRVRGLPAQLLRQRPGQLRATDHGDRHDHRGPAQLRGRQPEDQLHGAAALAVGGAAAPCGIRPCGAAPDARSQRGWQAHGPPTAPGARRRASGKPRHPRVRVSPGRPCGVLLGSRRVLPREQVDDGLPPHAPPLGEPLPRPREPPRALAVEPPRPRRARPAQPAGGDERDDRHEQAEHAQHDAALEDRRQHEQQVDRDGDPRASSPSVESSSNGEIPTSRRRPTSVASSTASTERRPSGPQ